MTDRVDMLTVALEKDMREDDVQALVNAISQLKGVLTLGMNVTNGSEWTHEMRVKYELQRKILEIFNGSFVTKAQ